LRVDRAFLLVPAQQYVGQFLASFKEFPPSQKVGSFSMDSVLESLTKGAGGRKGCVEMQGARTTGLAFQSRPSRVAGSPDERTRGRNAGDQGRLIEGVCPGGASRGLPAHR